MAGGDAQDLVQCQVIVDDVGGDRFADEAQGSRLAQKVNLAIEGHVEQHRPVVGAHLFQPARTDEDKPQPGAVLHQVAHVGEEGTRQDAVGHHSFERLELVEDQQQRRLWRQQAAHGRQELALEEPGRVILPAIGVGHRAIETPCAQRVGDVPGKLLQQRRHARRDTERLAVNVDRHDRRRQVLLQPQQHRRLARAPLANEHEHVALPLRAGVLGNEVEQLLATKEEGAVLA